MPTIALGDPTLPLSALISLCQDGARIELGRGVRARVKKCRAIVDRAVRGDAVMYGINTGFGKLAGMRIASDQLARLQRNLLLSHATGVGAPLARATCRLAFALRIHNLALGHSGVRLELLEQAM
ncbi:MAG: aromatic amino acid lyase, partial [Planctomycetes bacterium]|nr:aromatic amino acid lyase [Planctomycetota bacterium]